jgi:flagellar biosynthesis protein FlhA
VTRVASPLDPVRPDRQPVRLGPRLGAGCRHPDRARRAARHAALHHLPAAALAGFTAWRLRNAKPAEAAPEPVAEVNPNLIGWDEVSDGAALGLELGYGLIGLVDERKGAPLMARITGIRRQLSRELGFVVPLVRVRDNLALGPNQYRIIVAGVIAARTRSGRKTCSRSTAATSCPRRRPARQGSDVRARRGLDRARGPRRSGRRRLYGGRSATVVATHLNQIVQSAAADMFGMDEAQKLLDALKESAPQLVQGLTPNPLPLASIAALCRALLSEGVPLKDFRRIAEAMVDAAREEADPVSLVEGVRQRIGGLIVQTIAPARMPLPVLTLDAELENLLHQAVRTGKEAHHPIEPGLAQRLVQAIGDAAGPLLAEARKVALVTSPAARRALARLLSPHMPDVPVLSFLEIPDGKPVEVVAVVGGQVNRALLGSAA